jgi:hypothetical protein
MAQIGEILWCDGIKTVIRPKNGKKFSLDELQTYVGGYIEIVALKPGNGHATMYINEEGKLKGLPYNPQATKIAVIDDYGDFIVGNAIVVRQEKK